LVAARLPFAKAEPKVASSACAEQETSMDKATLASNPFALMMHPDAVVHAMEHSDRLGRLQRRICRPLDKSVAAGSPEGAAAFDVTLDDAVAADEAGEP
jgi:hypothetical protein